MLLEERVLLNWPLLNSLGLGNAPNNRTNQPQLKTQDLVLCTRPSPKPPSSEANRRFEITVNVITNNKKGFLMWKLLLLLVLLPGPAMAIEKPDYEVISSEDGIEIRRYPPATLAQTRVSGDFKQVGSDAFQKLGGYIFGKNVTEEKIAMTAPVTQTSTGQGDYIVSFYMPSKHNLETLPEPIDGAVEMVEMPETYFAARSYRGGWSEKKYRDHEAALTGLVANLKQWRAVGEPVWARYDPPMMPSIFRRNEVLIPIARSAP